ncbi:hypothetical protein LPY66_13025 [Dehalobacter sp. DCM]|uniref:hypothetical protein n=1 Tax=Dehalobacter sp. DCM TaxID=2907827 RepID=UPI0030816487|nr:hypothetical protein LPY66_13025 [Dehalobacter sp. DCM]
MKQAKRAEWAKLDNASKIFPATCNNKDTKVFRIACELHEPVDAAFLQEALNTTIEHFPLFKAVLRKGVFWYYFQQSDIPPLVDSESTPVCAPIYINGRRNLLFRVSYFHNRINLEVFHALSDGTGAAWFLKTLIHHYLCLRHKETFVSNPVNLNYRASVSEQMADSFRRYFVGNELDIMRFINKDSHAKRQPRVFHLRGSKLEENRMKVIEGTMSTQAVLNIAHQYDTTLSVFFTALFLYSIYQIMPVREQQRRIVLSVPINLRKYFVSVTARNFFSTMNIAYDFRGSKIELIDVIKSVKAQFQRELTEEKLHAHLNQLMSIEKNILARIVPLPIKNYALRVASSIRDKGITGSISHVGEITLPSEFKPFIRQFSICSSSKGPHITTCSYNDRYLLTFSSPFQETELQRTFFNLLAERGVDIEITSNLT